MYRWDQQFDMLVRWSLKLFWLLIDLTALAALDTALSGGLRREALLAAAQLASRALLFTCVVLLWLRDTPRGR